MNKIDNVLGRHIIAWLEADGKNNDAGCIEGATLLLQANRNRAFYNLVLRRPAKYYNKIVYELKKHAAYFSDGLTLEEVKAMSTEVLPPIETAIMEMQSRAESGESAADGADDTAFFHNGKRPDHDSLPEDIRSIWTENAERWKRIKEEFETCKALTMPCDRYEHLKLLKELWYTYREKMNEYDEFKADAHTDATASETEGNSTVSDAKAVTNARSYISKYIGRLSDLLAETRMSGTSESAEIAKRQYEELRAKIQQRVDVITTAGEVLKPETIEELRNAGITIASDHE